MEAQETLFRRGANAVKPLLTRFCVAKSVTYPPNLPDLLRTSPQTPALYTVKRCFALYGGGCLWGSSFSFLGGIYALKSAAFAPDLRAGCVGREYAFRKCKFIPPHIEKIFQPNRNNTWVVPSQSSTNLNHFYPVAGERRQPPKSRSTGFCSEQPEFVARQTAISEFVQTKSKEQKSPCLKFLKILRKLLLRSFLSRAWDRVPRS